MSASGTSSSRPLGAAQAIHNTLMVDLARQELADLASVLPDLLQVVDDVLYRENHT